jgi:anthranilate phosphoribosyltransferase
MQIISSLKTLKKMNESIREKLVDIHKNGESVEDIIEIVRFLESQKITIPNPSEMKVFDICGTGGTGKKRINLSTALALKLSKEFPITKHGNKASSGRCGSFDIIERSQFQVCNNTQQAQEQLQKNNIAFLFGPAFHPVLGIISSIRKSLPHPTIFNIIGPLINPMSHITAQIIGTKDVSTAKKLAEVCVLLGKNALLVHDTVFGLDEVSIGGKTHYFKIQNGQIEERTFVPEDFGVERVTAFSKIQGGESIDDNFQIFEALLNENAPKEHQAFLEVNYRVAKNFFSQFLK